MRHRRVGSNHQRLMVRSAALNPRRLVRLGLDHHHGGWVLAGPSLSV